MQKLTKEQAEWLIEKLSCKSYKQETRYGHNECEVNDIVEMLDIKETINQCTEKEFPDLRIDISDHSQIHLNRDTRNNAQVSINVVNEYAYLNAHEFKLLTEGCVKICAWLKEQEGTLNDPRNT